MDKSADQHPPPLKCRLVVIGSAIRTLVGGAEGFGNYAEIVAAYPDLDAWIAAPPTSEAGADMLVASCPTLFPETLARLRERMAQGGISRAVVVYDFAQRDAARELATGAHDINALRAPITPAELRTACEADIALATLRAHAATAEPISPPEAKPDSEIPPRQFSEAQLSRISEISTVIDCECPHHLATLLGSLNAFEDYSARCENRNDEDALLHSYLHRRTAEARAIIEEALVMLAEAEGFEL